MIQPIIVQSLFSIVFVVGKVALEYGAPIFLTGFRMCLAGVIILGYQYFFRKHDLFVRREDIRPLIALSFYNIFLTNALEFWGLQYLISAKACFLYNVSPFISAIVSYFIFQEKITVLKVAALVAGFLGFIPILLTGSAAEQKVGGISFLSWPELALLGAAVATVFGWIAMKRLVNTGYSVITANGISMLVGGIFSFGVSPIFEVWNPFPVKAWMPFLGWILLLTLISNIICYNWYAILLKRFSATLMLFAGFTAPFFTAAYGWLFLGETVTWHFYASAVIVFGSLYVYYREEERQGYIN